MKNKIIIVLFLVLFGYSFTVEPISDSIDTLAGATTQTFEPQVVDAIGGATEEYEDDDDDSWFGDDD